MAFTVFRQSADNQPSSASWSMVLIASTHCASSRVLSRRCATSEAIRVSGDVGGRRSWLRAVVAGIKVQGEMAIEESMEFWSMVKDKAWHGRLLSLKTEVFTFSGVRGAAFSVFVDTSQVLENGGSPGGRCGLPVAREPLAHAHRQMQSGTICLSMQYKTIVGVRLALASCFIACRRPVVSWPYKCRK